MLVSLKHVWYNIVYSTRNRRKSYLVQTFSRLYIMLTVIRIYSAHGYYYQFALHNYNIVSNDSAPHTIMFSKMVMFMYMCMT